MPEKPTTAAGYASEYVDLVRATCLYVATKLGDLTDDVVIVGGLVPSLIVDQENLAEGVEAHVGTRDLDVGLAVALLDQGRYRELSERLRRSGFTPDKNGQGNATRQRWKIEGTGKVTLDFLIEPTRPDDRGGNLRDIEPDFAAIIAPGLHLAFVDRQRITCFAGTSLLTTASVRVVSPSFSLAHRTTPSRRMWWATSAPSCKHWIESLRRATVPIQRPLLVSLLPALPPGAIMPIIGGSIRAISDMVRLRVEPPAPRPARGGAGRGGEAPTPRR
jgi:hypothetical protein